MVEPQPETKSMMNFIMNNKFTLSVALDGGSLVVTYPYDKPVQTGKSIIQKAADYTFVFSFMFQTPKKLETCLNYLLQEKEGLYLFENVPISIDKSK